LFLCLEIQNIDKIWLNKMIWLWKEKYPFEYIINKAEFYGLELYVDERVLIPRNDTEIMVDQAINIIDNNLSKIIYIDIWTWSSCIPIAILKNINLDKVNMSYVIDISKKALEVSNININTHKLNKIIIQLEWSLLTQVIDKINKVDTIVITANLPYIKDSDHDNMDNQTVEYEPDTALYWGPVTWFELYEELIQQCLSLKESWNIKTINLFIEIWFDQEIYSQNYLNNLWLKYNLFKDNWWIVRCIWVNI
jgi:release factor glutamine methyltransferase